MNFTLSDLLQEVYAELGQLQVSTTTGGDTDTLTDTKMQNSGKDDDWKDGVIFIIEADGTAPEGEYGRVLAYDDSAGEFTLEEALSGGIDSGDTYGLTSNHYPMRTMIELVNAGLRGLGDIPLVDTTTLDTSVGLTEYAAAISWKRKPPVRIDYQGETGDASDNQWVRVFNWEYVPAAPGSTGLIVFHRELPDGRDIRVWYGDSHPKLTDYDDVVAEVIAPELAVAAGVERALRWQNSRLGGGDPFLMQRWNDAKMELGRAFIQFPIWRPKRTARMKLAGMEE